MVPSSVVAVLGGADIGASACVIGFAFDRFASSSVGSRAIVRTDNVLGNRSARYAARLGVRSALVACLPCPCWFLVNSYPCLGHQALDIGEIPHCVSNIECDQRWVIALFDL